MENNIKLEASSENKIDPKAMSAIRERIHERIVEHSSSESNNNQ